MRNVVRLQQKSGDGITMGELINRYIRVRAISRPLGDSTLSTMNIVLGMDIAKKFASELESSDVIAMCQTLREGSGERNPISGATVRGYLLCLRGPLKYAAAGWGLKDITDKALTEAKPLLDQLQLASKSRPRTRRPETWEWDALHGHFLHVSDCHPNTRMKVATAMDFAVRSLRRRGEICRVLWEDFEDTDKPMLTIRDMKDPKYKKGNHHRFPLLFGAADIIRAQPMVDERIFPWNGESLGKRFIDAKKLLNIVDMRFHDIRRHGICNMLELGYSPAQVAAVSGHKNWSTLARVYGASINVDDIHKGPAGAQRSKVEAEQVAEKTGLLEDEEGDE